MADPSPGTSATPFSIDPVIGWRSWAIRMDAHGRPVLTSPMMTIDWPPLEPMRARCSTHFGRQVPNAACRCGLYAVSRLDRLAAAAGWLQGGVVGSVAMWGRVVEHTVGFRAQLAYPDRIRLVCGRCLISGLDGVPTVLQHTGDGLEPACATHARSGNGSRSELRPAMLQEALVSAYAIEPLPDEALRGAGYRAGRLSPARFADAARDEARRLTRGWTGALTLAAVVVAFLVVRAIGLLSLPEADQVRPETTSGGPAGSVGPVADGAGARPRLDLPRPARVPAASRFRFGVVCALRIGDRAEVVGCGRNDAMLGAYWSPPEPKRACDAYTRRPNFSVCWLDLSASPGDPLRVLRMPGVHLWDLPR